MTGADYTDWKRDALREHRKAYRRQCAGEFRMALRYARNSLRQWLRGFL